MKLTDRKVLPFLLSVILIDFLHGDSPEDVKKKKALLVKKHLKRLKKIDGGVKLVGGRGEFEGKDFCKLILDKFS